MSNETRNPSPPTDLQNYHLPSDQVGKSMYSKQWILSRLTSVVKLIDQKKPSSDDDIEELDKCLEDPLCGIWDMSADHDVASFLMEFDAPKIFAGIINKSTAPRLNEILIGIIANISTIEEIALKVSKYSDIRVVTSLLLEDQDSATILQVIRLYENFVRFDKSCKYFIDEYIKKNSIVETLIFILESSIQEELLKRVSHLILSVMDFDEALCQQFSNKNLIKAVLEAFNELRKKKNYSSMYDLCHIVYLISCADSDMTTLIQYKDDLLRHVVQLFGYILDDDDSDKEYINANATAASFGFLNNILSRCNLSVLRIDENDLIDKIIKITSKYASNIDKGVKWIDDILLTAAVELVSDIIYQIKDSDDSLTESCLVQLNEIADNNRHRRTLNDMLRNANVERSCVKIIDKMLEKFSKDDYVALRSVLESEETDDAS